MKIFLLRLAEKNGYSLNALIGVSEVSTKLGRYEVVRTGKRGRPRKDYVVSEQDRIAELKYILSRKEAKIKSLEMENELMRDFLSLTERK